MDNYSIIREFGMSKYAAQQWMDAGADTIQGSMAEMQAAADAQRLEDRTIGTAVGEGVMAAGAIILAATGESIVGGIVGAVVVVVGAIITGLTYLFTVECDEWDCPSPKTFHRRGIVGVDIGGVYEGFHVLDDGRKCMYVHRRCTLYQYFHDGLIIDGISKDENSADAQGRVVGCNGSRVGKYSEPLRKYWRKHPSNPQNIPYGHDGRAWEDPPNTWSARGWRVSSMLEWLRDKMPCRILSCMEEILKNTKKGKYDLSDFDAQRRRGSRWYGSLVWMMQDVWEIGQAIGTQKFEEVLRAQGQTRAADEVNRIRTERPIYPPNDLPWDFWPVMRHCDWEGLRRTLIAMKPLIPAEKPVGTPQPEGQAKRIVKVGLAPIMVQHRGRALIFDTIKMRPMPVKTGTRMPEWPVIMAGTAAAAIGAYAIYRALKKEQE